MVGNLIHRTKQKITAQITHQRIITIIVVYGNRINSTLANAYQ